MVKTHFIWDELSDNVLMETDELGAVQAEYTQEPGLYGSVVSQKRDDDTSFYHFDGQGSTRQLTDASENVTDTATYSAFGTEVAKTGVTVNPWGYKGALGYYANPGTYDLYVRARYLSPPLGMWTSQDPHGIVGIVGYAAESRDRYHVRLRDSAAKLGRWTSPDLAGYDSYTYAENSPIDRVDPRGLYSVFNSFYLPVPGIGGDGLYVPGLSVPGVHPNDLSDLLSKRLPCLEPILPGITLIGLAVPIHTNNSPADRKRFDEIRRTKRRKVCCKFLKKYARPITYVYRDVWASAGTEPRTACLLRQPAGWLAADGYEWRCPSLTGYGRFCGPLRRGWFDDCERGLPPWPPIDDLDYACWLHDCCVPTLEFFSNREWHFGCNKMFCERLKAVDCNNSPDPDACISYKARAIALTCGSLFLFPLP